MEKVVIIDGKEVTFKSSGAVPMRYKAQFARDYFKDVLGLGLLTDITTGATQEEQIEAIRSLDFEIFYHIAWTLAKTADKTIPEPLTWLDGFEEFPIVDILPELMDLLSASISSKKK